MTLRPVLPGSLRQRALLVVLLLACAAGVGGQPTAAQTTDDEPLPLYALPDPSRNFAYNSNTMALAEDALTLIAVNQLNNTITLLIPARGEILAEVEVGRDPRSVAITPDGETVLTANRGDNTLTLINFDDRTVRTTLPLDGVAPYGVVTNRDDRAYVSLQHSDEIAVVDLIEQRVIDRIATGPLPTGLALWGDFLYVTHLWSGDVSLIYLPERRVVRVAKTGLDTALSQSLTIDISRGIAYLPQTRLNAQNRFLTFDTIAFPVVNVLDLRTLRVDSRRRITLDTADQPVNMPFAVALDRFTTRIYVANAGTNDVSVVDIGDGRARAHFEVGANPRGILLNFDSTLLFVHNALDGTVSIIDTNDLELIDEIPITVPNISNNLFIGAQLFHSADDPRLSTDGWVSCATCHFEGLSDGRVWLGFPDGPRNTPLLYGLDETTPYNWSATWDELADVELKIRGVQAGDGLLDQPPNAPLGEPHSGLSADLDTLVTYILSLQAPPIPASADPVIIARGEQVFLEQNCTDCHIGAVGTNLQAYDVGTGGGPLERAGPVFDTPSLRWLSLSAPYFHDGSAETLREVFELPGGHRLIFDVPPEDIDALVTYLLSFQRGDEP